MSGTDRRMLHSDAFAWYMEKDPVLRSTIVAVTRLDRSPDWARLRTRIERLTRLVPSLRMRVQAPPLRIGPPRWTVDDRFDLDYHLRHARVAAGGGWPDVLEFARTAAMDDFDRSRPLWEFTVLDDLADGEAALVAKLHHSLTDGIGGIRLAALVVDGAPDAPLVGPAPPAPEGHALSPMGLTTRTVTDEAAEFAGVARRVARSVPTGVAQGVLHPQRTTRQAAAMARSVARFVAPVNQAYSTVLGERRIGRYLETLDIPLAQLHQAATLGGGHVNDAFLAALVGGLYRYHERLGTELDEVRVTVPVSVRSDQDTSVGGNRITLIRVAMPVVRDDPAKRIGEIADIMRRWRREPALLHAQEIAFGLNLLPRAYLGGVFKRIELVASDVPGIPQTVYLAGAKVTGYYGFGPTIGAGFNATLMSYAGTCNVGVNVDTGAVDDPESLLTCLRQGFDEIAALAPATAAH